MSARYPSQVQEVPREPHFAILTQGSVYVPGDERSRTNPGHGYPASTEYYLSYHAFTDRAEWEEEIRKLAASRKPFRALAVTPAKITESVDVSVAV